MLPEKETLSAYLSHNLISPFYTSHISGRETLSGGINLVRAQWICKHLNYIFLFLNQPLGITSSVSIKC